MRTYSRPVALAIDLASDVLPTPGGPTRQMIGPSACSPGSGPRGYSRMRSLTFSSRNAPRRAPARHRRGRWHLGALLPRNAEQPVEVVAHDGRLCGHRRHLAQLLDFRLGLLPGFLGQLRLLDAAPRSRQVRHGLPRRRRVPSGSPSLLVQVVLALGLLHLALDARADALFHLQHGDLALHQAEDALQPVRNPHQRENSPACRRSSPPDARRSCRPAWSSRRSGDGAEHLGTRPSC